MEPPIPLQGRRLRANTLCRTVLSSGTAPGSAVSALGAVWRRTPALEPTVLLLHGGLVGLGGESSCLTSAGTQTDGRDPATHRHVHSGKGGEGRVLGRE